MKRRKERVQAGGGGEILSARPSGLSGPGMERTHTARTPALARAGDGWRAVAESRRGSQWAAARPEVRAKSGRSIVSSCKESEPRDAWGRGSGLRNAAPAFARCTSALSAPPEVDWDLGCGARFGLVRRGAVQSLSQLKHGLWLVPWGAIGCARPPSRTPHG